MAVQMAIARTSAAELQVLVEHPSEPAIREYATEVFGDRDRAAEWFDSEIPSLGFETAGPRHFSRRGKPSPRPKDAHSNRLRRLRLG